MRRSDFWTTTRRSGRTNSYRVEALRKCLPFVAWLILATSSALAQESPATTPPPATPDPANPRTTHTITGTVKTHRLRSIWLSTPKDIVVWLPPGYDDPKNEKKFYPTLYMLDGQNVFDGATAFIAGKEWRADEAATELINKKEIEPIVIVSVSNAGAERANEYLPTRDPGFQGGQGGLSPLFVSFLADELKLFIEENYRVVTGSRATGICGSSFGGLCALTVALTRPNTFSRAAVMSPSVWWDGRKIIKIVEKWEPYLRPPLLYVDIGTNEGDTDAKLSETSLADARLLRDALLKKGWVIGKNFQYAEGVGDKHNEDSWARRFPDMLRFLFGPSAMSNKK